METVALNAPATGEPRRPAGGMFGMGAQPPEPKGDIQRLWETLGIAMVGDRPMTGGPFDANVVWQDYNPYGSKITHQQVTPEWVFVSPDAPGAQADALNIEEAITSGLSQLLFLYPELSADDYGNLSGELKVHGEIGVENRRLDRNSQCGNAAGPNWQPSHAAS